MDRFTGTGPIVSPYSIDDLDLHTWFERDRAHVELRDPITDETVVEWWDDAVTEAVDDGFLDPRDWKRSAFDYARHVGLIA